MSTTAATPAPQLAQKATQQPRANAFAIWTKEHERLMLVIGSLILIATFVIKDAIKDHLKDVVDAVAAGKESYFIHKQFDTVQSQLQRIANPAPTQSRSARDLQASAAELFSSTARDTVVRADLLQQVLRPSGQASMKSSFLKFDADYKQFSDDLAKFKNDPDNPSGSTLVNRANGLNRYAQGIEVDVLQMAEQRKSEDNQYYSVATWASYGLYLLGWSLAFVGRLFGVDPGTAG